MAQWEESALASHPLKPFSYFQFLDDIWGEWTHSKEEFLAFTQYLHNHQKSIKYMLDLKEVNFLDVKPVAWTFSWNIHFGELWNLNFSDFTASAPKLFFLHATKVWSNYPNRLQKQKTLLHELGNILLFFIWNLQEKNAVGSETPIWEREGLKKTVREVEVKKDTEQDEFFLI